MARRQSRAASSPNQVLTHAARAVAKCGRARRARRALVRAMLHLRCSLRREKLCDCERSEGADNKLDKLLSLREHRNYSARDGGRAMAMRAW